MKKLSVLAVAALTLGSVAAFEFDLNTVKPGVQLSSAADGGRSQLFPNGKPAKSAGVFRIANPKRPINGTLEVTPEHELVLKPPAGQKEGQLFVCIPLPKLTKVRITCSVKGEKFFAKGKGGVYNRFFLQGSSAGVFFRGNTVDVRYFDGGLEKPKWTKLQDVKDGEYTDIVMDIVCGDKPTYSVNEKKDITVKGKCVLLKRVLLNVTFMNAEPDTCIRIKNLKITEIK